MKISSFFPILQKFSTVNTDIGGHWRSLKVCKNFMNCGP